MSVRLLILLLLILSLAACAPASPPPLAVPGLALQPLPAGGGTAACWLADGETLALAGATLRLYDTAGARTLFEEPVAAGMLSCSATADRLLAALPGAERSRLLDCRRSSASCQEGEVPGRLLQIGWGRDGAPLLVTLQHQAFRFGENLSYRLFRWSGAAPQLQRSLHDVTIRTGRYRQLEGWLSSPANYAAAAAGELLLLPLPHDPPAVAGYFELRAFYLPTGSDWPVAELPLAGGQFSIDELRETVAVTSAAGERLRYDLWGGGEVAAGLFPATPQAHSPGGRVVVDAAGWHDGDTERQPLPAGARVVFAPDGRQALLYTPRQAALIPLSQPDPAATGAGVPLTTLRDWRAGGLIDAADYDRLRGK